jgi:hypothetical protein
VPHGGQRSVPWRLTPSVIDSVGSAGTEFARIAERPDFYQTSAHLRDGVGAGWSSGCSLRS